jgi:chromosome segregation ATPase
MEYLQERKSDINKLNDSVALLSADKGELEAEVSRLRSALESETADRQAAGVTVESLRLQLSHVSSELARVQTSEKTLSEQQVALNAALETQARELEDAAAIQVELLNTVREHKHAADDALAHGHALEVELGSVKAALARTQATLGAREDEAGRTTADVCCHGIYGVVFVFKCMTGFSWSVGICNRATGGNAGVLESLAG